MFDLRDICYGTDGYGTFFFKTQDGRVFTQWFKATSRPEPDLHNCNTFFSVNPAREQSAGRTKNEDILEVNVFYADFDHTDEPPAPTPAPTVIVASGGGYHCYWRLDQPCQPGRAAAIQTAWPGHVGADTQARDLARVLRVPGTLNYKYDPPRPVEVVEYHPENVYTIEALERALRTFKVNLTETSTEIKDPVAYAKAMLEGELEKVRNAQPGERNATLNNAAFRLGQHPDLFPASPLAPPLGGLLLEAALACGLPEGEAIATIKSGLGGGKEKPKKVEVKEAPKGSPTEIASTLADLGYSFALCKLDDRIYVNDEPLTDIKFSCMATELWSQQLPQSMTRLQWVIDALAAQSPFHPVLKYLQALKWDGADHIAALATYFTDPDDAFPIFFRRWLIGACAKASQGVQNRMLVLDGKQNLGKSHFARWVCPLPTLFTEGAIAPDNKDDLVRLITHWIWEVSELGATTRRADVEALKAFLSREQVTVRRPYGHHSLEKPACASFLGTVNGAGGFLTDRTGNRRFMVVHLAGIDWGYTAVPVEQVWAQAYALYQQGEPWMLTRDEVALAQETNRRAEVEDPIEPALFEVVDITGKLEDRVRSGAVAQALIDYLRLTDKVQYIMMRQAPFLEQMGAERGRDAHGMLWTGLRLKLATQFELVGDKIRAKTAT